MKGLYLLPLLLLVSACASTHWEKPGASELDGQRAYRACETETLQRAGGWSRVEPITGAMDIRECMQLNGYRLVKNQ